MELVLAFFLVPAASSFAPAQAGVVVSAVRMMDEVRGDDVPRPDDPRPRVIISADFPPLDVIPGGAGHGPAEKGSAPGETLHLILELHDTGFPNPYADRRVIINVK